MECWGESSKLDLCHLLCGLPAVGHEADVLGSVSPVFRGKKGNILTFFFAKYFEIKDCGMWSP